MQGYDYDYARLLQETLTLKKIELKLFSKFLREIHIAGAELNIEVAVSYLLSFCSLCTNKKQPTSGPKTSSFTSEV